MSGRDHFFLDSVDKKQQANGIIILEWKKVFDPMNLKGNKTIVLSILKIFFATSAILLRAAK